MSSATDLKIQYDNAAENLRKEVNKLPVSAEDGRLLGIEKIEIGKGNDDERVHAIRIGDDDSKTVDLVLTLKSDRIQENEHAVGAAINNFLKKNVKSLAENVTWDKPGEHAKKMMAALKKFQDAGAEIPYDVAKFRMFDEKIMEESKWAISDHAVTQIRKSEDYHVKSDGMGIRFNVFVPQKPVSENADSPLAPDPDVKAVIDNLKAHEKEILAKLAERVLKYTPDLDEKGKEALIAKIMALKLTIATDDKIVSGGDIKISIRSKDQQDAFETATAAKPLTEAEIAKLDETNPLNKLTEAQLGKAVGRSILHYGPDAKEIFPLIAGRVDVATTVGKVLKKFEDSIKATNPELATEVAKFRADDDLQKHDTWQLPRSERNKIKHKSEPRLFKGSDPKKFGEMSITFQLDGKDANEAIAQMAALGTQINPADQQPPVAAPDLTTQTFAAVAATGDAAQKTGESLVAIVDAAAGAGVRRIMPKLTNGFASSQIATSDIRPSR